MIKLQYSNYQTSHSKNDPKNCIYFFIGFSFQKNKYQADYTQKQRANGFN